VLINFLASSVNTYQYPFLRHLSFYVKFDIFGLQNIFNLYISGKVFFLIFVFCHVGIIQCGQKISYKKERKILSLILWTYFKKSLLNWYIEPPCNYQNNRINEG